MSDQKHASLQVTEDNEAELLKLAEAAKAEAAGKVPATEEVKADAEDLKKSTEVSGDQTLEIPKKEVEKAEAAISEGLDLESYYAEYAEKGSLSDESTSTIVKALESAKIANPEAVLAQYMAGAASQVSSMRAAAFDVTGGEEQYAKMIAWASENMSPAEVTAFDGAVSDPNLIGLAVRGLFVQFQTATGNLSQSSAKGAETSPRVAVGVLSSKGHEPLNSQQQLADLVSDPRFMKDPGFRATAEARIRASMDAGLLN